MTTKNVRSWTSQRTVRRLRWPCRPRCRTVLNWRSNRAMSSADSVTLFGGAERSSAFSSRTREPEIVEPCSLQAVGFRTCRGRLSAPFLRTRRYKNYGELPAKSQCSAPDTVIWRVTPPRARSSKRRKGQRGAVAISSAIEYVWFLIMSFRHAPVPEGRRIFHGSAEETTQRAEAHNSQHILRLEARPVQQANGLVWLG
jgi:hypothetical protein